MRGKIIVSTGILTLITILLAGCGNQNNLEQTKQQAEQLLNEKTPLVNVEEKTKQSEEILKKAGLTGKKLKEELIRQKAGWEIISKLKGDERKKYIIETKLLPQIIKSGKVNPKCTTTNLNNYVACLYLTKTPIEKLLNHVPKEFQSIIKKAYYQRMYDLDRTNLLKPTSDPIAIQAKNEKIKQMYENGLITNPSVCNKLPEQETKQFCKDLFNKSGK